MHASEDVPVTVSVRYWWWLVNSALHLDCANLTQREATVSYTSGADTADGADGIALYLPPPSH